VEDPPIVDQLELLVVIQPHVPGANPLPYTEVELQRIRERVPTNFPGLYVLGDKDAPATVQNVISRLSTSHIVHFACHGKQSVTAPLESSLILQNGHPLTVKAIMKQQIPGASLAFLSACETAMGAGDLPDEAMHLAASLLFAGFRGVVATMWSVVLLAFLSTSYLSQRL
jgi:CHAT domain-containing protein